MESGFEMNELKKRLYQQCLTYVQGRIDSITHAIGAAQQAANDETKSSAGDKYETGRAMMQQETDRNLGLLNDANKLMAALKRVPVSGNSTIAEAGSLVITDQGKFYIAISAGTISVYGDAYFAVSQASPIGAKIIGCKQGDGFTLNGKQYQIKEVF